MGVIVLGKTNLNVRLQTMLLNFGLHELIESCAGVCWIKVSWIVKIHVLKHSDLVLQR